MKTDKRNAMGSSLYAFLDSLKEIKVSYTTGDFLAYAHRIGNAQAGDFPSFVLEKRAWYICRLNEMANDPTLLNNIQALNTLKLLDRTGVSEYVHTKILKTTAENSSAEREHDK